MTQKIALVGFGTVGQGLCEILLEKERVLKDSYGYEYKIVAICDPKFGTVHDANGLPIRELLETAKSGAAFSANLVDWDAETMIRESGADVMCELAFTNLEDGEPALSHCKAAFRSGVHVATSNKGPAALAYREMHDLAQKHGVKFLIEGTVVSGTPILNLAEGPLAGCSISAVRGILNGTTNYILTQMEEGKSYEDALSKAQELGYAEADPTGDVEGYDARAKVAILTNVVMGRDLSLDQIACEGITNITPEDIASAQSQGARWKLIGATELVDGIVTASVKPEMVPLSHPLAGIRGATNALTFSTDLLGDITIVGPGAGRKETGFSILADLLFIHREARS